ncbi:MAG: hypothetical protein NTV54_16500, partial [Ignavibacteriales bacterium]|nr:hypothetical protein [Ignavibacteriales bacterium]
KIWAKRRARSGDRAYICSLGFPSDRSNSILCGRFVRLVLLPYFSKVNNKLLQNADWSAGGAAYL